MPQVTGLAEVGTITYESGREKKFDLREIEGRFLRRLYLEVAGSFTVSDDTSAYAIAGNPGSVLPSVVVECERFGVLRSGEANDWALARMPVFSQAPAAVADTNAVNTTAIYTHVQLPFQVPGHRNPYAAQVDLRNVGKVELKVVWGAKTTIVTGGTTLWGTDPVVTILAETSKDDPLPSMVYREGYEETSGLGTSANSAFEERLPVSDKGEGKGYSHVIVRAIDVVANTGRTHVATVMNEMKLEENGPSGKYSWGGVSGVRMQRQYKNRLRMDNILTGVYPLHDIRLFEGRGDRSIGVDGLHSLKVLVDHEAFDTAGVLRTLWGSVEIIR